jgi:SAM-dependent methyltransferase
MALYDRIGAGYGATRRADPRIERAIHDALGDARRVVNVGAGTGSYEPRDREVVAVEPSERMIAQRAPGSAPVVRAAAERLPFEDGSFDAALAVLTDHHWSDRAGGLNEMRRVARHRAVLFTWDQRFATRFWLVRDYLPGFLDLPGGMPIATIAEHLGAREIVAVPIPADCEDGFFHAYWARPEAYLDPQVRANISVFARLDEREVTTAVDRLRDDLTTGAWHERNAEILGRDELDLGYRLLIARY